MLGFHAAIYWCLESRQLALNDLEHLAQLLFVLADEAGLNELVLASAQAVFEICFGVQNALWVRVGVIY